MAILKDKHIEQYSNEQKNIGGYCDKKFVRIDSELFADFFKELIKSGSSYVSYASDLIREFYSKSDGKNFPIKYLSVLLKEERFGEFRKNTPIEVIGANIANALNVPTVYNKSFNYNGRDYLASIDFVGKDEEIVELDETGEASKYLDDANFQQWYVFLTEVIGGKLKTEGGRNEQSDKIISGFVKMYLLKNLLFQDIDFYPRNIKLLYNRKTKEYKFAPSFDYEYIMSGSLRKDLYQTLLEEDFEFLMEKFPSELHDFMADLEKLCFKNGEYDNSKLFSILKKQLKDEVNANYYLGSHLDNNIMTMQSLYNEMLKRSEKSR